MGERRELERWWLCKWKLCRVLLACGHSWLLPSAWLRDHRLVLVWSFC